MALYMALVAWSIQMAIAFKGLWFPAIMIMSPALEKMEISNLLNIKWRNEEFLLKGTFEGEGTFFFDDNSRFEGKFMDGLPIGHGSYKSNSISLTGCVILSIIKSKF
jgi:hypothetical protein